MRIHRFPLLRFIHVIAGVLLFQTGLVLLGQTPEPIPAAGLAGDEAALVLAQRYLAGGDGARSALIEALQRMGWSVRNQQGVVLSAPPPDADTGLALRDYEVEELLWNPSEQPAVRMISVSQALAVPFGPQTDPEELAQDLLETIRASAESQQPQQRFWARFIVALGRVSPANYNLLAPSPLSMIPLDRANLDALGSPVWPENDPVLAPSKSPARPREEAKPGRAERDLERMSAIPKAMSKLATELGSSDEVRRQAAQDKMDKLTAELDIVSQRQRAAVMRQFSAPQSSAADDDNEKDGNKRGTRFQAEWRDPPLSLLQIGLLTRVLAADLRLAALKGKAPVGHASVLRASSPFLLAMIQVAQAPSSGTSLGDQFSGAAGDIWAAAWGAYTGGVLEHYLPENKFSKGAAVANTIIVWFKTIMSVARQKITIEVENAPLVRTKTRSPGEQRTARAKVVIDFPSGDALKAIRAAGNLTSLDLQLPDGGPVRGAKVVWRLPEGSYNGKYQTAKGGWEYRPDLAVVQFAEGKGYVSTTNDAGEATITIEGVPQKKILSDNVRPYPRRAAIAVEVTIKVGNMTQDLNDAISSAMGGPIAGSLSFIADMVLRTSFFFQAGQVFEVTDWKEPAWEGEFEITVKGSGSKHWKSEKGGPDYDFTWSMDRSMEGRFHTPEWAEEKELEETTDNDGRHKLEIDGDSRYFRLHDSSSARGKNRNYRYEANGPLQIQPPGHNQLARYSRSEPSGSAELLFTGGTMELNLNPFFGAECLVTRSEQGHSRSSNKSGPEYLSLLNGVSPENLTITEQNDGSAGVIEGSKTFDSSHGELPYVPGFDVTFTIKYRLWKNGPPPKNKPR